MSDVHTALIAQLRATQARLPHVINEIRPHLQRALQNHSMSADDIRMRTEHVRRAGARLGRALQDKYGNNGTAGLISLLRGLASEHDHFQSTRARNRSSFVGPVERSIHRMAERIPETRGLTHWPIAPTPNETAVAEKCRCLHPDAPSPREGRPLAQQGQAEGKSGKPLPLQGAGEKLFKALGDIAYKGLPEAAAKYKIRMEKSVVAERELTASEKRRVEKGIVPTCPEGNPLATELNEFWIREANKLSPETAAPMNQLFREWATGPCPGNSEWSPIPDQWHRGIGDFGEFYGGLLGVGMWDAAGRQYGANELRESPHCYTLLETYLRFCTQPPRALQLSMRTFTRSVARAESGSRNATVIAGSRRKRSGLEGRLRAQEGGARQMQPQPAFAFLATPSERLQAQRAAEELARSTEELDQLTHMDKLAVEVAGRGGRPADPMHPLKAGLVDQIMGFVMELVMIMIEMIIKMIKAIAPAIIFMMIAPYITLFAILPQILSQRWVPALLGAPPYPYRPAGFTGPDPYDPYGPDTPEPRPYKNPGFEMCRTLLETYTTNCAFTDRAGDTG